MGPDPTRCNQTVVDFIGKKELKHTDFFFDKEGNLFELDDLANKYNLPLLSKELWDIIEKGYRSVWIRGDRVFTRKSKFLKQYLIGENK